MSPLTPEEQQTQRVYMSEIQLGLLYDIEKTSIKNCRLFAEQLLRSEYISLNFPNLKDISIKYVSGVNANAYGWAGLYGDGSFGIRIELPSWGKDALTVMHEFAHGLIHDKNAEEHGPEFLEHYIALMNEFMPWMTQEFLDACLTNGVRL